MSNFDSDSSAEDPWEDRGELAWSEFDWERYLRHQEESVIRYLKLYESARQRPDRIDWVAEKMQWGTDTWTTDEGAPPSEDAPGEDDDVYTLHKNPIYIATKAIFLGLTVPAERLGADPATLPQPLAVRLLSSLHRGEHQALEAVHALDFGDYAMAVSLFKRALATLNQSLAALQDEALAAHHPAAAWRTEAQSRLFDLREVWLRVIAECRDELDRLVEEDED